MALNVRIENHSGIPYMLRVWLNDMELTAAPNPGEVGGVKSVAIEWAQNEVPLVTLKVAVDKLDIDTASVLALICHIDDEERAKVGESLIDAIGAAEARARQSALVAQPARRALGS